MRHPDFEDRSRRAGDVGNARAAAQAAPGATCKPGTAARFARRSRRPEAAPSRDREGQNLMLVVVGGHTRNIGKTSVVAGLIAALPELNWTAIKITQYGHGVCSSAGEPCECAVADLDHPYAVSQETDSASGTDSSRYLAAGARRAYWIRTAAGQPAYALPGIRRLLSTSG